MICRQCGTPEMTTPAAIEHLVDKHSNRAQVFIHKAFVATQVYGAVNEKWLKDELNFALADRVAEYTNECKVYE